MKYFRKSLIFRLRHDLSLKTLSSISAGNFQQKTFPSLFTGQFLFQMKISFFSMLFVSKVIFITVNIIFITTSVIFLVIPSVFKTLVMVIISTRNIIFKFYVAFGTTIICCVFLYSLVLLLFLFFRAIIIITNCCCHCYLYRFPDPNFSSSFFHFFLFFSQIKGMRLLNRFAYLFVCLFLDLKSQYKDLQRHYFFLVPEKITVLLIFYNFYIILYFILSFTIFCFPTLNSPFYFNIFVAVRLRSTLDSSLVKFISRSLENC